MNVCSTHYSAVDACVKVPVFRLASTWIRFSALDFPHAHYSAFAASLIQSLLFTAARASTSSALVCACAVLMAPIVIAALLGVLQALIRNLLSDIGSVRSYSSSQR